MSDLISRQAAIDLVKFECGKWTGLAKTIENGINGLPPAQPKTGHWVQDDIASNVFRCSECGCDAPVDPTAGCEIKSNFCYMCGVDMRGEQDE